MRNRIGIKLLLLSSILGCSKTLPDTRIRYTIAASNQIKWCDNVGHTVAISSDVPYLNYKIIESAIAYWTIATGKAYFYSMGIYSVLPKEAAITIAIAPKGLEERLELNTCAMTAVRHQESGCISWAGIYIKKDCYWDSPDTFETIIRHELGHTIGLGHSKFPTDLMYPHVNERRIHPVNLSRDELILIKAHF